MIWLKQKELGALNMSCWPSPGQTLLPYSDCSCLLSSGNAHCYFASQIFLMNFSSSSCRKKRRKKAHCSETLTTYALERIKTFKYCIVQTLSLTPCPFCVPVYTAKKVHCSDIIDNLQEVMHLKESQDF